MEVLVIVLMVLATLWGLARLQWTLPVWTAAWAGFALLAGNFGAGGSAPALFAWGITALLALMMITPWRQRLLSKPMFLRIRRMLPAMSETERVAIEAGGVGWDAELFQGNPDWRELISLPKPRLRDDEQAFLDGPVEQLCSMLNDWQINSVDNDLPKEVWDFLKQHQFFGMIIPKCYGGLEFSAYAHSQVVMKISTRSVTAGVTVMVPNSLGPAELLMHYGTEAQREYYLPRLAGGEEIPCFALTGPEAGSDAGSIPDYGIVCMGKHEGREVLGLKVTWEKRYITLGPVATVLGLAFKAYDPDGLLGDQEDLGITCALIPTQTPGVNIGRRHHPGSAFQNGPNSGREVFVPLDWVIGGQDGVGQGWRMLMECLSTGRGISLPALSTGAGKMASRVSGAYARVRRQFRTPIGRFEGIEEALARIGGLTYMMDAARTLTTSALDQGQCPSVVSGIVKYQLTEGMRRVINDAMDIHGGRAICMGPSNYLQRPYQAIPVSITVEGANILTRSMIIFGQGAMRCHPYLLQEMAAVNNKDERQGLADFDQALTAHIGYTLRNGSRALFHGLSGARFAPVPVTGTMSRYYARLARMSAAFAFLADLALLTLGGGLKRREKLSGRFADALGQMYLCSASLKRFEDDGAPPEDLPLVRWAVRHSLYQTQQALDGILRNFPVAWLGRVIRPIVFPFGRRFRDPGDQLGHGVAELMLTPSAVRDRLTAGAYLSEDSQDPIGRMEYALKAVLAAEPIEKRLHREGLRPAPRQDYKDWLHGLREDGHIGDEEYDCLCAARDAMMAAIRVDDFAAVDHLKAVSDQAA